MLVSKNIGPYTGIEFDKTVGTFRVITYQAYNALGLIGSECNGIAILNEANQTVLLDEHMKQGSGYCGVGQQVMTEAKRICDMIRNDFQSFVSLVNDHPRSRYTI
jgi:hypothetical protein